MNGENFGRKLDPKRSKLHSRQGPKLWLAPRFIFIIYYELILIMKLFKVRTKSTPIFSVGSVAVNFNEGVPMVKMTHLLINNLSFFRLAF
jgi:hypothetical protein